MDQGLFRFTDFRPHQQRKLTGSFFITYECGRCRWEWHHHEDDYQASPSLLAFIRGAAQRYSAKFSDRWCNPMYDICVGVACDGLGHFVLTVSTARDTSPTYARAAITMETAGMSRLSSLLELFFAAQ
jgi:hypothetical protein